MSVFCARCSRFTPRGRERERLLYPDHFHEPLLAIPVEFPGRCTPDIAAPIIPSSRTEVGLSQGIPTRHDDLRQLCLEQLCHDQHPAHTVLHSGQDTEAHIIPLAHRTLPPSTRQVWCTLNLCAYLQPHPR